MRKIDLPVIEFHQHDWIPGFAAFLDTPEPQGPAFCVLNLGSMLCAVECGEITKAELPYFVAESMMHEVMHVIEKWAGAEFSEDRIESLLEKYRVAVAESRTA